MAMIVKEFEGRNEKEAIDRAIEELGLDRSEIDFEIVESKKAGILFRGGKVRIRVHVSEEEAGPARDPEDAAAEAAARQRHAPPTDDMPPDEAALEAAVLYGEERSGGQRPGGGRRAGDRRGERRGNRHPEERGEERRAPRAPKEPATGEPLEHESAVIDFVKGLLDRMGLPSRVMVTAREQKRLEIDVETERSGVLIGKQGKTLEAFQFLANLAAARFGADGLRVVVDTQDYRSRRERSLERMANQAAERVRRSRDSTLLEPLNPFERRIIHTALARRGDVETLSEGDGLYKRIRVIWRGGRDGGDDRGSRGGRSLRRGGRDRGDRDRGDSGGQEPERSEE